MEKTDKIWVVSSQVGGSDQNLDYSIDEFDLAKRPEVANKLRDLLGKGVFLSLEEAENWVREQTRRKCGCNGGCSGKKGDCCHSDKG